MALEMSGWNDSFGDIINGTTYMRYVPSYV